MTGPVSSARPSLNSETIDLQQLVNAVPSLISYIDKEYRYRFANKSYTDWFGVSSEEILGQHTSNVIGPASFEKVRGHMERALRGEIVRFQSEVPFQNGGPRWVDGHFVPDVDSKGEVQGFYLLVNDISKTKQELDEREKLIEAEREARTLLEIAEQRHRTILSNVPVILWSVDLSGTVVLFEGRGAEALGFHSPDVIGKSRHDTFKDFPELNENITRALNGETFSSEFQILNKYFESRYAPLTDSSGATIGMIGVSSDITERKIVWREMERAKVAAEEANRAKSIFLANVSHEIRTPLGVIQGFAELLNNRQEKSAADAQQWIATIGRNAYQLTSLIDELLDLSKIEAEKLEIEKIDFNLNEVLQDVTTLLQFKANEKGIKLRIISQGSVPKRICSDPKRLRQILINIIGNAIKFTEWGGVEVRMKRVSSSWQNREAILEFSIKDSGIGIAPSEQNRLFKPFSQADGTTTRKFGGTGLGLYISQRLAQALGGDLVLTESRAGSGSTFTLTIKCEEKEMEARSATFNSPLDSSANHPLEGVSVLLVEDSPDNQVLVSRFLMLAGAEIDIASNGLEGIQKALSGDHHVVLMDLQMPEVDGYEATRKLRSGGFHKPILAFTAHAMNEERDRCLRSGFDDHVSKPIKRDALIETIRVHAKSPGSTLLKDVNDEGFEL